MIEPSYLRDIRAAYDTVADDYAERLSTELAAKPLDRAMLAAFAEFVKTVDGGPVADIGCGPGHVTAYLHSLGLSTVGIDLSPAMVAVARRAYPELRFDEDSMTDLSLSDGFLSGIVARYSIIHIPPDLLPVVFAEFRRVLSTGGCLLLIFQVGDERIHVENAYGHVVSLDTYQLLPDRVAELLSRAGLSVQGRLFREPVKGEKVQQAYILAGRP